MWMSDAFAGNDAGASGVCLVRNAFILVEWAYLGRASLAGSVGRAAVYRAAGPVARNRNVIFNVQSVLLNVLYLLLRRSCCAEPLPDQLTACLINGTMCLLVKRGQLYLLPWFTGVRAAKHGSTPAALIALCAADLIVGAAVAHSLYSWNQSVLCSRCRLFGDHPFSPGWLWC